MMARDDSTGLTVGILGHSSDGAATENGNRNRHSNYSRDLPKIEPTGPEQVTRRNVGSQAVFMADLVRANANQLYGTR